MAKRKLTKEQKVVWKLNGQIKNLEDKLALAEKAIAFYKKEASDARHAALSAEDHRYDMMKRMRHADEIVRTRHDQKVIASRTEAILLKIKQAFNEP